MQGKVGGLILSHNNWVTNVFGGLFILRAYSCPIFFADMICSPDFSLTIALSLLKVMSAPIELSLDTDIKFDHREGVCKTLLMTIFLVIPSIVVLKLMFPLLIILNKG